jgi:hypothetical protein
MDKAEKTSSQTQQDRFASFEKSTKEGVRRVEELFAEFAKLEEQSRARVEEAVEESAKIMKQTIAYGAKLSEGWRQLALNTARQTAELWTSSWT